MSGEHLRHLANQFLSRDNEMISHPNAHCFRSAASTIVHVSSLSCSLGVPALEKVICPVLGVFGELNDSTEAAKAAENMRRVLTQAGHKDYMIKIFPKASHSLMEMPLKIE